MHREEIAKASSGKDEESGLALVPLQLYFRDGRAKVRSRSRGAASRTTSARRGGVATRDATREWPARSAAGPRAVPTERATISDFRRIHPRSVE